MNESTITMAVCDTEPIAIEGLRALLEGTGEFRVAGAHSSLLEAAETVRAMQPALLLVDKAFGGQAVMDWLRALRDGGSATRSVVWGLNLNDVDSLRFLQAGAAGVIRKSAPLEEVIRCLRTVGNGGAWLESALLHPRAAEVRGGHSPLTAREAQVMELVERGMKNKDIAAQLGICTGTVKIHLKHIFEKTGIRGRYGLAINGLKDKGLLVTDEDETTAVPAIV